MPRHQDQPESRTRQIRAHNQKAIAEGRHADVLPEQSATRIWEPHEWNAELERQQKARGETPNIARPVLGPGFATLTSPPAMKDLNQEAQEKAVARKAGGRKAFPKGISVERPD